MNYEDEIHQLQGMNLALGLLITRILVVMPSQSALRMLIEMEIDKPDLKREDLEDSTHPTVIRVRDGLLGEYQKLLDVASKRT